MIPILGFPFISHYFPARRIVLHKLALNEPEIYRPGDEIQVSGIYRVMHDPAHVGSHEVICVEGKVFPPCRGCDHPRFVFLRAWTRIEDHEHFMTRIK
jgi:hypothetical protein